MISSIGAWAVYWLWQNASVGNFSAGVIVAILAALLWPRLRRAIHSFIDAKLHAHREEMKADLAKHHAAMKAHVACEIAKINKPPSR